jgi:hypothetical protein
MARSSRITAGRSVVAAGKSRSEAGCDSYFSSVYEPQIQVRAKADVRGREVSIMTDGPEHFKVDITVPTRADLYIRLTAGELHVEHVEGNKDIGLHAGEIDIDVVRPDDYHSVSASVWAGELHAAPFNLGGPVSIGVVDRQRKVPARREIESGRSSSVFESEVITAARRRGAHFRVLLRIACSRN